LIGHPLRWKVKLSKAPTQMLDYYFMRSSFDPDDVNARHNLDSRVATRRDAGFGWSIGVELTVREGGRSTPVPGRPFYLDMTFASEHTGGATYLGLDFGTCTSSLSYVDADDILIYAARASDQTWLSLSSLVDLLPYPAAHPLGRFLSETSAEQMNHWGREAFEGMLSLIAYTAFAEHRTLDKKGSSLFKGFRQRSAGPLWALFKTCARATGSEWVLGKELFYLSSGPIFDEIERAIPQVALYKHGKQAEFIDYPRLLEKLGNVLANFTRGKVLGYFENVRLKAFGRNRFQGVFRNAQGPSAPFIDVYEYEGVENFASEFVFLIDLKKETSLPMFPLLVHGLARSHYDESALFLYDIARNGDKEIVFRAVQEGPEVVTSATDNLAELFEATGEFLKQDPVINIGIGVKLRPRSLE
jgi:hypothetical protein